MSTVNVQQLLDSVANVTRERDADHLRLSLIRTLGELLPLEAAEFIEFESSGESPDAQGSAAMWSGVPPESRAAALLRASAGQGTTQSIPGAESVLLVQPVSAEQALSVRLEGHDLERRDDEIRIVQAFARLYSNFTSLIRDTELDRLTGLFNRRSFDGYLGKLADLTLDAAPRQPRRGGAQPRGELRWWLMLFDVDHFKRINDGYGHLYGDEVLLLLARLVRQMFRGEDRCFRYGGEEFAVVLARNDMNGVRVAAERMRQKVADYAFPQVGQVTISIGCAEIEPGLGPTDVIDRADRMLYEAKHAGRNRTVCFGDHPRQSGIRRPQNVLELF